MDIINDILDISTIEAGKLSIEEIDCSPVQLLSDVANLMAVKNKANGLRLRVEFDGSIPETIQTDPTRLRQVLLNLAGNAVTFTEIGTIRLITRLVEKSTDDPKLQIDVIDSGIGKSQEQVDGLFNAFVQADTSTAREFGGTGLGLTIFKRLSEKLGGTITVQSAPGKGCTFSTTIATNPLAGVTILPNPSDHRERPALAAIPAPDSKELDCRLLFAEDGPDNHRLIAFVLKKAGAIVTVAENGQIALDHALQAHEEGSDFDLILMDMQIPVLVGYSPTRKLREANFTLYRAHCACDDTDRQECLDAGCDDYAAKPINRKGLIAIIADYVSKDQTGSSQLDQVSAI